MTPRRMPYPAGRIRCRPAAAAALLLLGCTDQPTVRPDGLPHQIALPLLTRVPVPGPVDTLIIRPGPMIAVSDSGTVAISGALTGLAASAPYDIHLIDPDDGSVVSIGRHGDGPEELSAADRIFLHDSLVEVFEPRRRTVLRFTVTGRPLGETTIPVGGGYPLALRNDSLDLQARTGSTLLWRRSRTSGHGRSLLPAADSFARAAVADPTNGLAMVPTVAYAAGREGFVLGWPQEYRLAIYSRTGRLVDVIERSVPPKHRSAEQVAATRQALQSLLDDSSFTGDAELIRGVLDTLDRQQLPHFAERGLHLDGHDRLWVIGPLGDDSTFADVFHDTSFVGRHVLPCREPRRRIALRSEWLALLCEVPAPERSRFELQLYRIVEPDSLPH